MGDDVSNEGVDNPLRTAFCDDPAVCMSCRRQRHAHCARQRSIETPKRVCCHPAPQRSGLFSRKRTSQQSRRRQHANTKIGQRERMSRHAKDRLRNLCEKRIELLRNGGKHLPPTSRICSQQFIGDIE